MTATDAVERFELVLYQNPADERGMYLKRVIALPGEIVEMRDGRVYLNGRRLDEPFPTSPTDEDDPIAPLLLAANEFFVLGDYRHKTNDSRSFGPIKRDWIVGKLRGINNVAS